MIVVCSVPAGTPKEALDPFPGSDKAIGRGCTCPERQHGWPGQVSFDGDCPVHELERVPS